MSAVKLVEKLFEGTPVRFDKDGWFSATDAAKLFDFNLNNWAASTVNQETIIMVATQLIENQEDFKSMNFIDLKIDQAAQLLIVAKRGKYSGGTWMHPKLAFWFALSLNKRFAVWVQEQIEHIAAGNRDEVDWYATRYRAKSTFKDKCGAIKFIHPNATSMDYVKAANEILFAVFGTFTRTGENDRDNLSEPMLELISVLQDFQMIKFLEARLEHPEDQDIHNRELRPHLVRMATYHRERLGLPAITHTVAGKEYSV